MPFVQMNKVHFSSSWQSEKNGTRNEMRGKKKKRGNVTLLARKCCQMDILGEQPISPVNVEAIFTTPELLFLFVNPVPCKVH